MISKNKFFPGSTLGILGGGQLGRMLAIEAKKMGYTVHVYDPSSGGPAAQIADYETNASFEDEAALERFFQNVDFTTFEFENISTAALKTLEPTHVLHPSVSTLGICQNRIAEKKFVSSLKIRTADFEPVTSLESIETFVSKHKSAILKTAELGYDGKGQLRIHQQSDLAQIWKSFSGQATILESIVPFDLEISVICARNVRGEFSAFPVTQNNHVHHILDTSVVPASVSDKVRREATDIAKRIAENLELVGILCIEMFVVGEEIYVNELAPRPHNSGHYTLDYCPTSQFEQHLRAISGLPLGETALLVPSACMINILGDVWAQAQGEPKWDRALSVKNTSLHLYGKKEAKTGRKMGHICTFAPSAHEAIRLAKEAKAELTKS